VPGSLFLQGERKRGRNSFAQGVGKAAPGRDFVILSLAKHQFGKGHMYVPAFILILLIALSVVKSSE
jgi:hypothetical protein